MPCSYSLTCSFDNDDMKSSKRNVTLLSLIFLLKCFSKSFLIRTILNFLTFTFNSIFSKMLKLTFRFDMKGKRKKSKEQELVLDERFFL